MKTVTLYYRETHFYKGATSGPVKFIEWKIEDDRKVEVLVLKGIAYASIYGNYEEKIYAAIKETPEELAKNPDIELVYVNDKKE